MKETIREYLLREGVGYTKRAPKNIELTFTQKMLINEMIEQGERPDIAGHLSRILKTKEQQQVMMKYLISIRDEHVSEAEVIQVAVRISEGM